MNWYIGQRVLYCPIDITPKETVITGLKDCACNCGGVDIETPAATDYQGGWHCTDCGFVSFSTLGRWRHYSVFRPLEENFAERVLSEAIESAKEVEILIETYKEEKV